jgi:hypothetical protein
MFDPRVALAAGLAILLAGAALPAAAQAQGMHQCTSASGQTWWSRTPCPAGPSSASTTLRQYGPVPERSANAVRPVSPGLQGRANEHTQYLGAECARIADAIRTGPSRGVSSAVVRDLRAEYQKKCQDEDQEARQKAWNEEKRERTERKAARDAEQTARADAARVAAQCDEMLSALSAKRRRADTLTPGERDDLARFQARYDERCKAR